jgi:alpha-galactosidase
MIGLRCRIIRGVNASHSVIAWLVPLPPSLATAILKIPSIRVSRSVTIAFRESGSNVAVAARLTGDIASNGFPSPSQWDAAMPLRFSADWQGKNPDSQRETEVRLLWSPETLFIKFHARFRTITVFSDSDSTGRRDQLWDCDVAEVFLQPDASDPCRYREFEVSPNSMWLDLDILRGQKQALHSGLRRRVSIDHSAKVWTAELALPMESLLAPFDPAATWRVNFFRVEGPSEPRFYGAWRPTNTPQPNFHVPAAFGQLIFG